MTRSVLLVLTIYCVLGALSSYSFAVPITEHRISLSTPSSAMKLDLVCRNDSVAGLYLNHDQGTTINSIALVTLVPFMNQIYYANFMDRFEVRPYYIRIPLASDTFILDQETKKGSLILPSLLYTKLDPFHFRAIHETAKFFTNVIQILLTKFVIVSTSNGTKAIEISLDAFNNQELRHCLDQTDFQLMANAVGTKNPTSQDEFHLQDKNRPWIPTFSRICFAMGRFNRIAQDLPKSLQSLFSQYFPTDCQPQMHFNQTAKWADMKPTLLAVREFNYDAIKSYAVSTDIPTDGYVALQKMIGMTLRPEIDVKDFDAREKIRESYEAYLTVKVCYETRKDYVIQMITESDFNLAKSYMRKIEDASSLAKSDRDTAWEAANSKGHQLKGLMEMARAFDASGYSENMNMACRSALLSLREIAEPVPATQKRDF